MIRVSRGLVLGAALFSLAACAENDVAGLIVGDDPEAQVAQASSELLPVTGPSPTIDGRSGWSGAQSAAFNDLFFTARDERGWRLLWQLVGEDPPGPLPDGGMAVAVFLGARSTAGFSVDITRILSNDRETVVEYRETTPVNDDVAAQVLTAPYAIELTPADGAPVHYRIP